MKPFTRSEYFGRTCSYYRYQHHLAYSRSLRQPDESLPRLVRNFVTELFELALLAICYGKSRAFCDHLIRFGRSSIRALFLWKVTSSMPNASLCIASKPINGSSMVPVPTTCTLFMLTADSYVLIRRRSRRTFAPKTWARYNSPCFLTTL